MIRYYCDGCGKQVTEDNQCAGGPIHCNMRLGGEVVAKSGVKLKVEVITSLDGVANGGCFCKHCVVQAINELAKPEPEKQELRPLEITEIVAAARHEALEEAARIVIERSYLCAEAMAAAIREAKGEQ